MMRKKEGVAVFKRIMHILIGWGKSRGWLETTSAEEKLQELRMEKCKVCFHSEESSVLKIIKGEAKYDGILRCKKCHCPCKEKTIVVDEECPIDKW